jgi:hypothetical protein
MNRRLEDRIRLLCAGAIAAGNDDELHRILAELKSALQEQGKRLKGSAVLKLVTKDNNFQERRCV